MFTGLIEETGLVLAMTHAEQAPEPGSPTRGDVPRGGVVEARHNVAQSGNPGKKNKHARVNPGGVTQTRITISAATIPGSLKLGDSVSVSGVCLTAVEVGRNHFSADLASETLQRTSLGSLKEGSCVNLELPMRAGDRLGGHIVQGHVDGVGQLLGLKEIKGKEDFRLTISIPDDLARYVVPQGSITVEGISLTVAGIQGSQVEIAIIPHTWQATNLHTLKPGAPLNIEVDVLAKYAEKNANRRAYSLTVEDLIRRGF